MTEITQKQAFKTLYRKARLLLGEGFAPDRDNIDMNVAMNVTDYALQDIAWNATSDWSVYLSVNRAVLWAIHWRFCKPRADLPQGMSERHLCFDMAHVDSGEESRVWFQHPKWP